MAGLYNALVDLKLIQSQRVMMDRRVKVQPINHLLKMQVVALVLIVLFLLWWQGTSAAIASYYGSFIVVANTLLQRWHLISAAKTAQSNANLNLRKAYRCVAQRWVLTIVMFSVGFAMLQLAVLPLMTGFIVAQLALLFGNPNRA